MSVESKPDIDLHAYVDGELDPQSSQRVRSAIETDPEVSRHYQAIKSLKEQLATEIGGPDKLEVPDALVNTVRHFSQPAKISTRQPAAWAAAACLLAGVAGGYLWGSGSNSEKVLQHAETAWVEQVANYHAMYTLDTLEHVKTTDEQRAGMLSLINSAIEHELVIPEFPGSTVEFKRGQVLTSGGQPVIQLAYLDTASDTPIAVCFTLAKPASASETLRFGEAFDVNYVNWQNGELDFLVVGSYEPEALAQLAESVQSQFAGI